MISNAKLAAKLYHLLYPRLNFYKLDANQYRRWIQFANTLTEQGIING